MFDFEKLLVFQKAKSFNQEIYSSLYADKTIDRIIANQLRRAALSIPLTLPKAQAGLVKQTVRIFTSSPAVRFSNA